MAAVGYVLWIGLMNVQAKERERESERERERELLTTTASVRDENAAWFFLWPH
jgi:hypothetical protein